MKGNFQMDEPPLKSAFDVASAKIIPFQPEQETKVPEVELKKEPVKETFNVSALLAKSKRKALVTLKSTIRGDLNKFIRIVSEKNSQHQEELIHQFVKFLVIKHKLIKKNA